MIRVAPKGFFVAGTDTAVGKTRVTAGLIAGFRALQLAAGGMKPVACGLIEANGRYFSEDVDMMCRYSGQDPESDAVNPYAFRPPISPHIAAAHAGTAIELDAILRSFSAIAADHSPVCVEGAGGWLTPISERQTMADIAIALDLPVVLVVGLRLGCLNHSLLTALAIRAGGLPLAGWIANRIDPDFAESEANLATLATRLGSAPLAVLPHSGSLRSALPALAGAASQLVNAASRPRRRPAARRRRRLSL
jgi:dethiobiotin synthetase